MSRERQDLVVVVLDSSRQSSGAICWWTWKNKVRYFHHKHPNWLKREVNKGLCEIGMRNIAVACRLWGSQWRGCHVQLFVGQACVHLKKSNYRWTYNVHEVVRQLGNKYDFSHVMMYRRHPLRPAANYLAGTDFTGRWQQVTDRVKDMIEKVTSDKVRIGTDTPKVKEQDYTVGYWELRKPRSGAMSDDRSY